MLKELTPLTEHININKYCFTDFNKKYMMYGAKTKHIKRNNKQTTENAWISGSITHGGQLPSNLRRCVPTCVRVWKTKPRNIRSWHNRIHMMLMWGLRMSGWHIRDKLTEFIHKTFPFYIPFIFYFKKSLICCCWHLYPSKIIFFKWCHSVFINGAI